MWRHSWSRAVSAFFFQTGYSPFSHSTTQRMESRARKAMDCNRHQTDLFHVIHFACSSAHLSQRRWCSRAVQGRIQEIPSRSIYKNSSTKQTKLSLVFGDIFSIAIKNDLPITFTSRFKVDAKCVYQQWNWITVANYFGTTPSDWVHGYLYFEPGPCIWTKGFRPYLHIAKNWSGNLTLNSIRVRALSWPLLGIFSGIFL